VATGVSPIGLVIRLYETIVGDLGRAVIAVRDNNIEKRSSELQHALAVIGQLQGCLDMGHGSEPAKALDRFYDLARGRMIQAQLRHSGKILEEVMRDFLLLRDAWAEVEKQTTPVPPSPNDSTSPTKEDSSAWVA
jgi:flagellar biosynthetic protein FliS